MKTKSVMMVALCVGMTLAACQKEKQFGASKAVAANKEKAADNDLMAEYFAHQRQQNTQVFEINNQEGGFVVAHRGTQIQFQPNTIVHQGGKPVQGRVIITVNEFYDQGERVFNNVPTDRKVTDADIAAGNDDVRLITGGAVDIQAKTPNGENLALNGAAALFFPGQNTGGVREGMKAWEGEPNADNPGGNDWAEKERPVEIQGNGYIVSIPGFGYWNIDQTLNSTDPRTIFRVDLPAAFDNTNAEIFIFYDNYSNMLSRMDVYVPASSSSPRYWGEHGGNMNVNQHGTVLAIGKDASGTLYASFTPFVASSSPIHQVNVTSMPATTEAAILATIATLP